jgi:cell wall-associated NlpC family hydrolase
MQYAFKQVGVDIPRIAASQFNASNGVQISGIENLAAGDLLFFTGFNSRGRRGITHVSMYLGNGKMVHAMNPSYGIQVSNFFDDYWLRHYYGAVRIRR